MLPSRVLGTLLCGAIEVASVSAAPASSLESRRGEFRVPPRMTDDGLPQARIACLQQTHDGCLWIGTQSGLARFDGVRFIVFNKLNTPAFTADAINALAEDADGTLWIGTPAELLGYSDHCFKRVSTIKALQDESIWHLCSARRGGVWIHAGDRVVRFADGQLSRAWKPPFGARVLSLQEGPDGWLNVFTDRGWLALSSNADQLRTNYVAGPKETPWLAARLAGGDNRLWVRKSEGLFLLECGAWAPAASGEGPGPEGLIWQDCHLSVWNDHPAPIASSVAPHFWQPWVFYVLGGAALMGLAVSVQGYRLRWQHRLLKLEEQRSLANERTRIARDLHDDLGTALTGLALELDVAGRQAKEVSPLAGRLSETARRTRDLAERMREVVWTVNPECDTVSSLASFLEQQVSQFLKADSLHVRLDFPEDIPPLPLEAEARHQLALSVREALTNVVRHAQATEVAVSLAIVDQTVRVQVKDNGHGFRQCQTNGHGLANMQARMERVHGRFECLCEPDGGTLVSFVLPIGRVSNAKP